MDDLFLMTSLSSKCTGLPFPVWVLCSNFGTGGDEIPIWIGDRNPPVRSDMTHLTFDSELRLIRGAIAGANLNLLRRWVELNFEALQEHRNGETDSAEFIERLRRI